MRKCLQTKGRLIIEAHAARITSRIAPPHCYQKILLEID